MERTAQATDAPLDRVFKLLPAESTGAFLLIRGFFPYDPAQTDIDANWLGFALLTLVIVVATPFIYNRGATHRDVVGAVFITCSFVIWALNIEMNRFIDLGQHLQTYLGQQLLVQALFTPQFLGGLLGVWVIALFPLAGFRLPAARGETN